MSEIQVRDTQSDILCELATIRVKRGLTAQQVADRLHVTRAAVSQIENAHRRRGGTITLARILAYANAIGATIRIEPDDA